jgi:hypothetical protein
MQVLRYSFLSPLSVLFFDPLLKLEVLNMRNECISYPRRKVRIATIPVFCSEPGRALSRP